MPRKLGQHFLASDAILARIAEAACPVPCPRLIEIGPGRGALTRRLIGRTEELHALEIDSTLIPFLKAEFGSRANFHLHHADVLATNLAQWGPAVIAGNLPYYITSPIIEKFLFLGCGFERAVFLVQEEVADRLRASPGTRDYGFLSVQTQLYCSVEFICRVPPGAFSPPPKVHSAVIHLNRHSADAADKRELLEFVSRCFTMKRKTLRNNLKPYYAAAALNSLPEANLRAEQLSIEQFSSLFRRLEKSKTEHSPRNSARG